MTTRLDIPDFSLVVLAGPHGAGKSTLAALLFDPDSVVARDTFRKDESFFAEIDRRLAARQRVVVDAPNAFRGERVRMTRMARTHHAPSVAIVVCAKQSVLRDRIPAPKRQRRMEEQFKSIRNYAPAMDKEGFATVHIVDSTKPFDLVRQDVSAPVDHRHETGAFDIIGDLHGCFDEASDLLVDLGYELVDPGDEEPLLVSHPDGRRACLVGDLVDRGPNNIDCLRLAMGLVAHRSGFVVPGNHDYKLMRALRGEDVKIGRNLAATLRELELDASPGFRAGVRDFLEALPHHLWLDAGNLVLSHAGTPADMIGRDSKDVRQFCLFGKAVPGDDSGRRVDWAQEYDGSATVVHGHVVVRRPTVVNNVIDVDTGCAFGGQLTALRWPEKQFRSVAAKRVYAERNLSPMSM